MLSQKLPSIPPNECTEQLSPSLKMMDEAERTRAGHGASSSNASKHGRSARPHVAKQLSSASCCFAKGRSPPRTSTHPTQGGRSFGQSRTLRVGHRARGPCGSHTPRKQARKRKQLKVHFHELLLLLLLLLRLLLLPSLPTTATTTTTNTTTTTATTKFIFLIKTNEVNHLPDCELQSRLL